MKHRCVTSKFGYSVSPLPSEDEIAEHYRSTYYQAPTGQYQSTYDQEEITYFKDRASIAFDFASAHSVSSGSFLDLGCGEGFALAEAKIRGFRVYGVDHSLYGIERHNPDLLVNNEQNFKSGDAVAIQYFEGKTFDFVYCKNVVEHVVDPEKVMDRIAGYLAPNGIAIIEVPNDFSALHEVIFAGLEKEHTNVFCPPVHLHYFSTNTIQELASSRGFSVLDTFSDYPIDHLLLEESFNYYSNKDLGRPAHSLRRKVFRYLSTLGTDTKLDLLRAMFKAGLGRDICIVVGRASA